MNVRKEAHPVNCLYVLVNYRVVERLPGLGADMDADGVLFYPLITDDTHAGDGWRRGRLGMDELRREEWRKKQENSVKQASADAALLEEIHQTPFPSLRGATKLTNR
jgi:hypothetical protein